MKTSLSFSISTKGTPSSVERLNNSYSGIIAIVPLSCEIFSENSLDDLVLCLILFPTKYGIALNTFAKDTGDLDLFDLDGDGEITENDIKMLDTLGYKIATSCHE